MSRKSEPAQEEVFAAPNPAVDLLPPDTGHGSGSELLARSRTAWELGDWNVLAALAETPFEDNRDRAKLALLAAVGLAQLGRMDQAQTYARLAQGWGCPATLMARVLVGGVLNSLGRVASLLEDAPLARQYFEGSVQVVSPEADATILGRARHISEKAGLGLLPEAARMMQKSLDHMQVRQAISAPEVAILKSQVQLLKHTLALAQKRHQILPVDPASPETPDLESRATSQLGQDLWVLAQTGYKRRGFFVDLGASDGVLLSNTFLLETGFGWAGICAEPNPQLFRKLQANRSCITAPECIMGRTGQTVEFILADEYGGAAEFARNDHHGAERAAFQANGETVSLQSVSLEDLLKKHDAPRTIDYLSIDTEGSEYEILKAFPFDQWDIRLLTVEHNFTPIREDIRLLLEGHGYSRTEMQWDDWYFRTAPA